MPEHTFIDTADWIKAPGFRFVKPALEQLLGIAKVNHIYRTIRRDGMSTAEFCSVALEYLSIEMEIDTSNRSSITPHAPLCVLGNHPTGIVESLMLCKVLEHIRPNQWKILSNKFVASTPEFSETAIPLDPFNLNPEEKLNARGLVTAARFLKNGGCIGAFPSGRIAPTKGNNGLPIDSPWNPHLVRLARMTKSDILLVSFPLDSSSLLRALPMSHPRVRAMALFRETLRSRPSPVRVRLISPPDLSSHTDEDASLLLHARCHDISLSI